MKIEIRITIFIILTFICYQSFAQEDIVGKIIYIEGKVKVKKENWEDGKIQDDLSKNLEIKALENSLVEIKWINGTTTTLVALDSGTIFNLYADSNHEDLSMIDVIIKRFQAIFQKDNKQISTTGAIRRSKVIIDHIEADRMYWKENAPVSFSDILLTYQNEDYKKVVPMIKLFMQQNSNSPDSRTALFILGHSYIMLNNSGKAKDIFTDFLLRFPDDDLADDAREILLIL